MPPRLALAGALVLGVFAFAFNWQEGHRGLFLYDASIVFDGGWRLLQGQAPYKDFAMSHAPGTYFLEAAFMKFFGVTYGTMVLVASVLNAAMALLVARILWRFSPTVGLVAGFCTAIWYQPHTGYLQVEQASFFFDGLGLWLLLEAGAALGTRPFLLRTLGGAALAYGILCKQNSGGIFVPVALAAVVALPFPGWKDRLRALAPIAAGAALCFGVFGLWLVAASDPALFWHHAVQIPGRFGRERLIGGPVTETVDQLLLSSSFEFVPRWISRVSLGLGLFALLFQWVERRRTEETSWALLLCGVTLFQNVFVLSALNQSANGVPFVGLQLGLLALVGARIFQALPGIFAEASGARRAARWVAAHPWPWRAALAGLALALAAQGYRVVHVRKVNEFRAGATFRERLNVPGLEGVYWGEPTHADLARKVILERRDLEAVAAFLRDRNQNFFVFPVSTMLYGLLGKPSVQPWLFFLEGHSFATADLPRLDAMAVASLERNQVRIYVKETTAFLGEQEELSKMPRTSEWLRDHFAQTRRFGLYEVWEWKE